MHGSFTLARSITCHHHGLTQGACLVTASLASFRMHHILRLAMFPMWRCVAPGRLHLGQSWIDTFLRRSRGRSWAIPGKGVGHSGRVAPAEAPCGFAGIDDQQPSQSDSFVCVLLLGSLESLQPINVFQCPLSPERPCTAGHCRVIEQPRCSVEVHGVF